MSSRSTRYLDRARMAARVGVIGRVTPVAAGRSSPSSRALQRIHQEKGVAISVRLPGRRAFPGREAGSRGDARQPARQRLQMGPPGSVELTVEAPRDDEPRRRPPPRHHGGGRRPGPHRRAARAASASAACGSTRPSPVRGSGCRSCWSWPTPTAATANWPRAHRAGWRYIWTCRRADVAMSSDPPQWSPVFVTAGAHSLASRLHCDQNA